MHLAAGHRGCAGNHPQGSLLQSPGLGTPYGRGCVHTDTMCHEKPIFSLPWARFSTFSTTKLASLVCNPQNSIFFHATSRGSSICIHTYWPRFFHLEMETFFNCLIRSCFENEFVCSVHAWGHVNATEVHTKLPQNWGCYSLFLGGIIWLPLHLSFLLGSLSAWWNCKYFVQCS